MGGSISLGGDIRKLTGHMRKLKNISFAATNEVLAQIARTSTRDRFREQKAPDGKAWIPSIRVKEEGGVTLTQTSRLKNSIRAKSDDTGFAVGTNVIYARRHQLGDKKAVLIKAKKKRGLRFQVGGRWITKGSVKVKIPARPFLGISEDDLLEIKATLEEMVSNG